MRKSNRSDPDFGGGPRYPGSFLVALRQAVADLGWKVKRSLGDTLECLDAEGHERTIGLENLYRRLRREGREQWPAYVANYLGRLFEATAEEALPDDLNAAADRILVRIGQKFAVGSPALKVWSQKLGDTGLCVNLVVDSPETMAYVSEEMVARSGRPGEEWLRLALDNMRARTPAGCLECIDQETGIHLCSLGDAYDAARALLLADLLPDLAELGCFVAVPTRDALLALPVTPQACACVHFLKVLAEKHHKSDPYSISAEVYWVRADQWHRFPIELRGQEVIVTPPPEFVEVFKDAAPDDAGPTPET